MSKDKPEGIEAQEQQEKEFINEFLRMSDEAICRQYEEKNRDRIAKAPLAVRDAFDKVWTKVTGQSYYQPVTTIRPPIAVGQNNTERTDPKGRNYRTLVAFKKIKWTKVRRKVRNRFKDFFILDGTTVDDEERPIYQNLTIERVRKLLNDETGNKILKEAKSIDTGEIEGRFDIKVEGYWEVIFSPQKDINDKPWVESFWEGQCLRYQRQIPVAIPGFHLEAIDNATRQHFTQTPQEGRKIVGTIQEYAQTALREITRKEYLVRKAAGDKIQREFEQKQAGG